MKYFPLVVLLLSGSLVFAARPSHTSRFSTRKVAPPLVLQSLGTHPVVALTFDDLPAAGGLPPGQDRVTILTTLGAELRANHLEGTYGFVNAIDLENDEDAQEGLHAWLDAGMNIGNHTWSHQLLPDGSVKVFERQIAEDEPSLEVYARTRDWRWFRYPALLEGETVRKRRAVLKYLAARHYHIARVTLDFEDDAWNDAYARCAAKKDEASVGWLKQSYMENAQEYIRFGREEQLVAFGHEIPNVMLLHATAFTTLMLPDLLNLLRREGFSFAALADVERDPAYTANLHAAFRSDGSLTNLSIDARHLQYPAFQPKPFDRLNTICR